MELPKRTGSRYLGTSSAIMPFRTETIRRILLIKDSIWGVRDRATKIADVARLAHSIWNALASLAVVPRKTGRALHVEVEIFLERVGPRRALLRRGGSCSANEACSTVECLCHSRVWTLVAPRTRKARVSTSVGVVLSWRTVLLLSSPWLAVFAHGTLLAAL